MKNGFVLSITRTLLDVSYIFFIYPTVKFCRVIFPTDQILLAAVPGSCAKNAIPWPEIADMDSEHVRTLTNKMADLLYINH
jgi:hypothetical protein